MFIAYKLFEFYDLLGRRFLTEITAWRYIRNIALGTEKFEWPIRNLRWASNVVVAHATSSCLLNFVTYYEIVVDETLTHEKSGDGSSRVWSGCVQVVHIYSYTLSKDYIEITEYSDLRKRKNKNEFVLIEKWSYSGITNASQNFATISTFALTNAF